MLGFFAPERAAVELGYPIFRIHGLNDFRILACHGERVNRVVKPGSEIWLVPDAMSMFFEDCTDQYVYKAVSYFRNRLVD